MALVRDQGLRVGLALAARELHENGGSIVYDVHGKEIIDRYFATNFPLAEVSEHYYEDMNLLLRDVRRQLRDDGIEVVLVNQLFFVKATFAKNHGETWPHDHKQAKKAMPRGKNNVAAGLHFHNGPNDLIWEVAKKWNVATGAGKVRWNVEAVLESMEAGTISDVRAGEIIRAAQRRIAPTRVAMQRTALKAIEPYEEDEI
jgi:hypothetical protein